MKISFPRLEVRDRQIQLSAEVQGFAQPLWFRFDRALEKQITLSADPFVVSLLLLAMLRNEPLVSEAPVSKKLLEGLGSFQRIFHEWFPERFSIIEIQAEICARTASNGGEASAFSGGVDSFYTFKKLEPGLSGALFMAGFDMPLNLKTSIAELTESYSG
ncbi:MAG: hypothetical protein ACXWOH_13970, partial [Bdellovibrionota bacterium]